MRAVLHGGQHDGDEYILSSLAPPPPSIRIAYVEPLDSPFTSEAPIEPTPLRKRVTEYWAVYITKGSQRGTHYTDSRGRLVYAVEGRYPRGE